MHYTYQQGFWSEVNGATFQDLMFLTSSNYETLSRAISMRGAGGLCGCLLGNIRFNTCVLVSFHDSCL